MPDFYEEDEPLAKIEAAFERAEKVHTAPPRGQTVYLDTPAAVPLLWPSGGNWTT